MLSFCAIDDVVWADGRSGRRHKIRGPGLKLGGERVIGIAGIGKIATAGA
jgi:hypothetical protein